MTAHTKLSVRNMNIQLDTVLDLQKPSPSDPPLYPIRATPSPPWPANMKWRLYDTSRGEQPEMDGKFCRRARSTTLPGVRGTPSMLWQISSKDSDLPPSPTPAKAVLPPIGSERRRASLSDLDPLREKILEASIKGCASSSSVNPVSQSPVSPTRRKASPWSEGGREAKRREEGKEDERLPVLSPMEFKELLRDLARKNRYAPAMPSPLNPRSAQAPPRFRTTFPMHKRFRQFRTPLVSEPDWEDERMPARKLEPSLRVILLKARHIATTQYRQLQQDGPEPAVTMISLFDDEDEDAVMDIIPSGGSLADELRNADGAYNSATLQDDLMIVDGPTDQYASSYGLMDVDDHSEPLPPSLSDNWAERIPESPRLRDADSFDDFDEF